jgi:hypothetical protein
MKQVPLKSQPSPTPPATRTTPNTQLWAHTPPAITLPWLSIGLPLVIWDTIYILGRPHTFAGGAIAWPLWIPYELYGRVDPVYSPESYYNGLGWTGAQALGNVFETLAYFFYVWIVVTHGRKEGKVEGLLGSLGALGEKRRVGGMWGAVANLVGYTTFMVTLAKTVLYSRSWETRLVDGIDADVCLRSVQRCLHGIPDFLAQQLVQLHLRLRPTQVSIGGRCWC